MSVPLVFMLGWVGLLLAGCALIGAVEAAEWWDRRRDRRMDRSR